MRILSVHSTQKKMPSARIELAILSLHTEVILVIRFTTKPRGPIAEPRDSNFAGLTCGNSVIYYSYIPKIDFGAVARQVRCC